MSGGTEHKGAETKPGGLVDASRQYTDARCDPPTPYASSGAHLLDAGLTLPRRLSLSAGNVLASVARRRSEEGFAAACRKDDGVEVGPYGADGGRRLFLIDGDDMNETPGADDDGPPLRGMVIGAMLATAAWGIVWAMWRML